MCKSKNTTIPVESVVTEPKAKTYRDVFITI